MSHKFEALLESVQDSVFRNNQVTKEQVTKAIELLMKGKMAGLGEDGQLSEKHAEALQCYIDRLARMRWECTGSREPLFGRSKRIGDSSQADVLPLSVLLLFLEELFPRINSTMKTALAEVNENEMSAESRQIELANRYVCLLKFIVKALCKCLNFNG